MRPRLYARGEDWRSYGRSVVVFQRDRPMVRLYGSVAVMHATPDGGPVPRGRSSWRTACGLMLTGRTWRLLVQVRRFYRPEGGRSA